MDVDARSALDRLATAVTIGAVAWWVIVALDGALRDNGPDSQFWSRVGYVAALSSWPIVMAFVVAIVLDLANPRMMRARVLGVTAAAIAGVNAVAAFGVLVLDKQMRYAALANRAEAGAVQLAVAFVAGSAAFVALRAEVPTRATSTVP